MASPRPRLNPIELTLIGAAVAVAGFATGARWTSTALTPAILRAAAERAAGVSELDALQKKYGPSRNSRDGEEWIVRDFFKDRRGGVFVDVGANHYQHDSNTYYLETALGWSGLAIEPQQQFATDYVKFRPRTTFVPLFVSDVSSKETTLYVPKYNLMASADAAFARTAGEVTPVPSMTTTMDDVLDRHGISHIDFVSMDIELGEPAALAGFTIERFRPALVCVEAHREVRQQILDYFARHGYVALGDYWLADSANFWFAPLGGAVN